MFNKGKSFSVYPVKVLFDIIVDPSGGVKAGVTVSSRNFKRAVQRNRVKRILREAYRVQKLPLQNLFKEQEKTLVIFFIYVGKELPDFNEVHHKMEIILGRLFDRLSRPEV